MAVIDGVIQDGYRSVEATKDEDGRITGYSQGEAFNHTVQEVGNFTAYYQNPSLKLLAGDSSYPNVDSVGSTEGGVYLTGFKLESMIVSTDQQLDNAKVIPLVNGDTITLTNRAKCGTISFNASRTSAGLNGGDCIDVFDFCRTQGNKGGKLTLRWGMNNNEHTLIFKTVCVKRCPPVALAGNDVADYQVQLTYADFSDSDSPAYNSAL